MFYDSVSLHYTYRRDFTRAIKFNDFVLSLGRQTTDINSILNLLLRRSRIAYSMQDICRILGAVKEARALGLLTWSTWLEINFLHYEAYAHCMLGNLPRAHELNEHCYEQVIGLGIQHSDRLLSILDLQTDIHLAKTEYLEAKKMCDIATAKVSPTGSPFYYAHFLAQKAYICILTGSKESEILENVDTAEAVYTGYCSQRILLCSWVRAELDLERGDCCNALSSFKQCLSRSLGIYMDISISCLAALGDSRNKLNNPWSTLRWAMTYFGFARKNKRLVATFHALRCLADFFAAFYDQETALSLFHVALEGATHSGIHRLRAECMVGIGDIMCCRNNIVEAKEMWEAAHPLFVRSSQTKAAVVIKARLEQLSSAGDNQEDIVELADVSQNSQVTANQDESKNLAQLALLSVPQNPPSPAGKGSMQPTSANGLANAPGELTCNVRSPFWS
jgi:hypothetical protein